MSNNAVGVVYEQIINEVISSSRVDFEEGGVDESVLEELKKGWQEKLSQLEVASFSWDPKEAPAPVAPPPTTAAPPPAAPYSQAQLSPQIPGPGLSLPGAPLADHARNAPVKEEPYIKQEPGVQNVSMPPAQQEGAGIAAYRAAQHVRGQFGEKGAGSINAIQASATSRPAGQPALPQMPSQPAPQQQQYRPGAPQQGQPQQQQQQQQQQRPPSNGQPGVNPSQTDGTGDEFDFEGVLLQRDADGNQRELGRVDIDRMIHARIAANAKSMEGGGLMLPLKEATRHKSAALRSKGKEHGIASYDGYDDDEVDEDAINSDLDDPDEDKDEDEVDDEGLGHIMLCMYDKVQRVKNKWKCILKDGVLTVNGKEYVFHKATGEYEW
ncbi:transcription factor IIA [Colletotrichum higginsianum]|uniref:Transcription initiation factor IIA large subunit n=2 Tax=Colletotrichum higginsianum TaxID=80884 RepID=H1VCH9_COLHI|nr:Transcription factor IIA [Colletotrichum higginsianum IMI 349063]OBR10019.1 Transcription factor IIA [Colletotrichum higginsianum IMI 349063]TID07110.1 Transcription initiation factor IIA large subunit [Colletotrichum higginsianum]CCF37932.1 transcription factor IIA [Colletotrichum higginsianum]